MRKVDKILVVCDFCGEEFKKYKKNLTKTNFCNRHCKNNWQKGKSLSNETKKKISKSTSGEKNGMYRKHHNGESKRKISKEAKKHFLENPELKFICGNSRLSKKERYEIIKKGHLKRTSKSYSHPHTYESKKLIGIKSSAKFTPEYKRRIRKKLEEEGKLIPLNKKDDYKFYFILANWKERMYDYIKDKEQLRLLKKYGVLNVRTNSTGVVRDHIYSRRSGFENRVFPEILRHPFNCQLITHSQNVRKKVAAYKDKDEKTLEDIFFGIKNYRREWFEQNKCLELINKYENGERYHKTPYIEKYYET